jgi:hypothetical protein
MAAAKSASNHSSHVIDTRVPSKRLTMVGRVIRAMGLSRSSGTDGVASRSWQLKITRLMVDGDIAYLVIYVDTESARPAGQR